MNIHELLYRLGVTPNYKGYHQVVAAAEIAAREPGALTLVTKRLYPEVARRYGTTGQAVERNIRLTIKRAWEHDPELLGELAGYPLTKKPTAAKFVAILAASSADR